MNLNILHGVLLISFIAGMLVEGADCLLLLLYQLLLHDLCLLLVCRGNEVFVDNLVRVSEIGAVVKVTDSHPCG